MDDVELWFQDESRFGLMTHVGRCLTAMGTKPLVSYQHKFANTYLWGSYSPITGDSFVWEIDGVGMDIFEHYLRALAQRRPRTHHIVLVDNAGFHSIKGFELPDNVSLLRIPPYSPELNPCEQIWQYIKQRYKNTSFETMPQLRKWLHQQVKQMKPETIKSITANPLYTKTFISVFYNVNGIKCKLDS